MNLAQFKDPVSYMSCLHSGSILVSNTSGGRFEPFSYNDKFSDEFSETFRKNFNRIDKILNPGTIHITRAITTDTVFPFDFTQ